MPESPSWPGNGDHQYRSRFFDITIAFDTSTIVEKYPGASTDENNPTVIDAQYIRMKMRGAGITDQPGDTLTLPAEVGDVVRWSETTMSSGFDYSALLYRHGTGKMLSHPALLVSDALAPFPDPDRPGSPAFDVQTVVGHAWAAFVTRAGSETRRFSFQIVADKELQGYFCWDLTIYAGLVPPRP
ncbi:AidA/PixA family protein [Streptomyces sp. URMC 129]|uniref:AidA/PixA family protein n=1 Tax=Streptomyces sp. URMC 129 TaxID=3423407 RepID=UPI003F1AA594